MIGRIVHLLAEGGDHLRPAGEAVSSWAGNALVGWTLQWLVGWLTGWQ